MEVEIPPAVFNLGAVSQGSDRCIAGAASDPVLETQGGKLPPRHFPLGNKS